MLKKLLIITAVSYFLLLFQTSFLVHFNITGQIFNLVFIGALLLNVFEKAEENSGLFAGLISGFFLDIFSSEPIGFYIVILFALSVFIKLIVKKYVHIPKFKIS